MVYKLLDRCRFISTTVGTGNINVGSALTGHQLPGSAGALNGDNFDIIIEDGINWEIANVTYNTGSPNYYSRNYTISSSNSGSAISLSGSAIVTMTIPQIRATVGNHLYGHISGCQISATGSSTTFYVGAGVAVSQDNFNIPQAMILPAQISKTFSSLWSPGNGGGALDTGSTAASTWYYVYLIAPNIFGSIQNLPVDVICSLSSSSPTMPTNYSRYRRIGVVRTTSSSYVWNIAQFGDRFMYPAIITDYSGASLGSSWQNLGATVPTSIPCEAVIQGLGITSTAGCYVYYGQQFTGGYVSEMVAYLGSTNYIGWTTRFPVNNAAFYVSSTYTVSPYYQWVSGFIDQRGKQ